MRIIERFSCARTRCSRRALLWFVVSLALLAYLGSSPCGPPLASAQTAGDSLYAVLYNGSDGYYVFMNDLKFMFKTLINDYGYTKDNILVLSYNGSSYDLDEDGQNDIDFSGTRVNADTVFARLQRVVTNNDLVFFYATDHGTSEYNKCADAALSVYSGDPIYEENLTSFFDRLDTANRKITKIIQLNTCYAGGMIPELKALDYPLMIMTASKECEVANHTHAPCDTIDSCHYCAYSFWWTSALHGAWPQGGFATAADYNGDGKVSIQEAARYAVTNDEYAQKTANPKEHPLYWDSDCLVGQYTALDGKISGIPGMIAFRSPCHEPPPCRWGSSRCGGGAWGPSPPSDEKRQGTVIPGQVETVLWSDLEPAPGGTTNLYAKVVNPGDTPLTGAQVSFYYSNPTLSLIYPQSGLYTIGTETIPVLLPHDSLTVGPVPFVAPPGGNTWGEPYWTLMATAEHYNSPVETGWLENDNHVAANNSFEIRAYPNELKTIHFSAQNALDVPVKAVLSIDDSEWPAGWMVNMSPAAGDSIEMDPDSSVPVQLQVMGVSGLVLEGFIDVTMELNTTTASECESCDDSTCGGYIGQAGGCSVKLVVEGTIGVAAPQFDVTATATAITLAWEFDDGGDGVTFNVYRAEKSVGDYVKLNSSPIAGSGRMTYADGTADVGKTYLYMLGVVDGGSERMSRPVEASLAGGLEFDIEQNYPNPFNPSTTIRFSLPEDGAISVRIYDTAGGLVKTLFAGTKTTGVHTLHWNGDNARGEEVSSGVYYCRIETANGQTKTTKLVILR